MVDVFNVLSSQRAGKSNESNYLAEYGWLALLRNVRSPELKGILKVAGGELIETYWCVWSRCVCCMQEGLVGLVLFNGGPSFSGRFRFRPEIRSEKIARA